MFVSFLMPYVDRGQGPLFQGLMLQQLAAVGADELMFVADERYFRQLPAPWGQRIDAFGFSYICPSEATFQRTPRHVLSEGIFADLAKRCGSMLRAFRLLLTEEYPPLRRALEALLAQLRARNQPEAILTWCNCPSLTAAAAGFGVPVIHNELGPLRKPHYAGTVYFDFEGVNGRTSAQAGMATFARVMGRDFRPLPLEDLRALFVRGSANAPPSTTRFPVGAVLQVEDDSNLLAYGNGWTNFELIFAARARRRPDEVLIRKHPRGYANYSDQLGAIDDSPNSGVFLDRCDEIYTINSSVAFECLLRDKPFTALGDSPAAALSRDKVQGVGEQERLVWLNYLFLCYLVPESFLYDVRYYRWRLAKPDLREVYARHLVEFQRARETGAGEQPRTDSTVEVRRFPVLRSEVAGGGGKDSVGVQFRPSGDWPEPSMGLRSHGIDSPKAEFKRTILFVGHEASRTGAPIFLLNFIRWLRERTTWEPRILLRVGGPLEGAFRQLGETYLGSDGPEPKRLFEGVNLIYSNTCTNGAFLDALCPGDIPILTHVHELDYVIDWFGRENFNQTARQTAHFIACSDAVAQGLVQRQGIAADRVSVRHEAISVDAVLGRAGGVSAAELRRSRGLEPGTIVVAACGCADWRKGPDLFLQAAARVRRRASRPAKFLWIGLLPDDERGRLLRRDVELLGLDGRVEFVGEQENPAAYLELCDVFCLPSREDPFPLVVLEAAALGKPTVCFEQAGGAPEFCALGGGCAVPYLDAGALADRLTELIEDESRRLELGRRAAELARERFDIEVIGPGLMDLIERWARRIRFGREQPARPAPLAVNRTPEAFRHERYQEGARIPAQCPDDIEALLGQARCHWAQGHFVLAGLLAEQVLESDPGNREARRILDGPRGEGERQAGKGKPGKGNL